MPSSASSNGYRGRGRPRLTDEQKAVNSRLRAELTSKALAAAKKKASAVFFDPRSAKRPSIARCAGPSASDAATAQNSAAAPLNDPIIVACATNAAGAGDDTITDENTNNEDADISSIGDPNRMPEFTPADVQPDDDDDDDDDADDYDDDNAYDDHVVYWRRDDRCA